MKNHEAIKIKAETVQKLRKIKKEKGVQITWIIETAVEEYIKKHYK